MDLRLVPAVVSGKTGVHVILCRPRGCGCLCGTAQLSVHSRLHSKTFALNCPPLHSCWYIPVDIKRLRTWWNVHRRPSASEPRYIALVHSTVPVHQHPLSGAKCRWNATLHQSQQHRDSVRPLRSKLSVHIHLVRRAACKSRHDPVRAVMASLGLIRSYLEPYPFRDLNNLHPAGTSRPCNACRMLKYH